MDKKQLLTPIFLKYQAEFESNPRSRVFAPLAESYRKAGLVDKALDIVGNGIKYHPDYVLGYLVLANCYFDLNQFNLSYTTLRPLVEKNRDNIRLQRLFADTSLSLDKKEEALNTYKYILFVNPKDKEVQARVKMLEEELNSVTPPVHKPISLPRFGQDKEAKPHIEFEIEEKIDREIKDPRFNLGTLKSGPDFDSWSKVDLINPNKKTEIEEVDQWSVSRGKIETVKEVEKNEIEEISFKLEEVPAPQVTTIETPIHKPAVVAPIITHTLVDLYCNQGHFDKAIEILEKIIELNPHDQKSIDRLSEIRSLTSLQTNIANEIENEPEPARDQQHFLRPVDTDQTEEEGREFLMSILDQELAKPDLKVKEIEAKLWLFLDRVQNRARQVKMMNFL